MILAALGRFDGENATVTVRRATRVRADTAAVSLHRGRLGASQKVPADEQKIIAEGISNFAAPFVVKEL
jgi:hypothetical protein